jgi:hypothetical protein
MEVDVSGHLYRNITASRIQEEMKNQGWTNPDGFGFYYHHPEIQDATGLPIIMPAEAALKIQRLREERERPSADDTPFDKSKMEERK